MAITVETLEKLERKITLNLPVKVIQDEVDARLRKLARQVKIDGFRPGKVPLSVVAQRYGYSVHYEVMNDKVGEAFSSAANEAQLRVAGAPRITESESAPDGEMAFDAVFEVYPEVKLPELATLEIERLTTDINDAAIDRTLDILRKQRRTFAIRAQGSAAAETDRVTVDFEGKIDGESFQGGKAEDFNFVVGEGQMLKEFEDAVRGMQVGQSKTFPLAFPADYHGKDVAGKTADFMVTVKKIEAAEMPALDGTLAKSLGIEDGSVDGLRDDIRSNLDREVKFRLQGRNKSAVMEALATKAELELPKSSVQAEVDRMIENARVDLKKRGIKDAEKAPMPEDLFRPEAERRVRLGLVVSELVRTHNLQAKPEQIRARVDEIAGSYEKPADVVRWYYSDNRRMAEVEAVVIENNVTDHVLAHAKAIDKVLPFDDLMAPGT